ncbi:unnamed protein product [Echinostoma caproni]|uniref:Uncharacterized protein n=1 Tax=Echinostoma caproni TaxID=27848 RepID=A0A183AVA5_9TREM|nr:unnamed protein product [Echinostoma caproni]
MLTSRPVPPPPTPSVHPIAYWDCTARPQHSQREHRHTSVNSSQFVEFTGRDTGACANVGTNQRDRAVGLIMRGLLHTVRYDGDADDDDDDDDDYGDPSAKKSD